MELEKTDKEISELIKKEEKLQAEVINLIASENYVSKAVREATASVLTNKYAEGYPGRRYYGGSEVIDEIEQLAIDRAKKLFGAEHANVQPYSGTNPNFAVYFSLMETGDTALAMGLKEGGHLSHGSPLSISGKLFNFVHYGVGPKTELIDYDQVEELAKKHRPKLIVAGASAYSRLIDYKRFREIADEVNASLLVDMAHIAGLVAAKVIPSPVPYVDFVTSSTHKTLRGPRGGLILCKEEFASQVDKALFPGLQGGPMENQIAAKAVCFAEAGSPEFVSYSKQVIKNAQVLANELNKAGLKLLTGGTDNHLINLDFGSGGPSGKEIEEALGKIGIVVNREMTPTDTRKPYIASGIRLGTPAVTTRGIKEAEMIQIGKIVVEAIKNPNDPKAYSSLQSKIKEISSKFPVP